MVAIVDYGMGNLASVQKALNFLKIDCCVTADHTTIYKASHILLPGVGSFLQGMQNLQSLNLIDFLSEEVMVRKKNFLGICLGMQLLAETSEEPYRNNGLGWIKGHVVKMTDETLKIPHMGWNNIEVQKPLYYSEMEMLDFYFIHSYHFVPSSAEVIAAKVEYGSMYVASIQQDNIFATQFHPEKSQRAGLMLLKSYFEHVKN